MQSDVYVSKKKDGNRTYDYSALADTANDRSRIFPTQKYASFHAENGYLEAGLKC
jgi:hypothetical protein